MHTIKGKWYPKGSAKQHNATMYVDSQNYRLYVDEALHVEGKLDSLHLDERLGNIARKITLKDDSLFITNEHDAIAKIFGKKEVSNRFLHTLESRLSWAIGALVLVLIGSYLFVGFGIPYFSQKIAHALPLKTNEILAQHTMKILDEYLLETTELSMQRQADLAKHFKTNVLPLLPERENFSYNLHFRLWRDGKNSLPNALALPSGDIIFTDKLIELCDDNAQLDAIIFHEVGHIVHRDSLTMLIEGAFVSAAVMVALGDLSGFADMGIGLGSMLVSMHYSREHERRADLFAYETMLNNHQDPIAFATIMDKMEHYMKEKYGEENSLEMNEYASTHPQIKERIALAKHYSQCFKNAILADECQNALSRP